MASIGTRLLIAILIIFARFLQKTCRYHYINNTVSPVSHENFVYAFYHQNLLATLLAHFNLNSFVVMVSASKDGDLISAPIEAMNHVTVRGSTSRGGIEALKKMIRLIHKGHPGAITIDGPRGPYKDIKDGIFQLSRLAQIPIIPIVCYPKYSMTFRKSWDQFRLPFPWTKIIIVKGSPIYVDSKSYDSYRTVLRDELLQCELKAKQYFNPSKSFPFD
jgi:lysophospholipid acyltransferase (LPLAT)-like uncharacterized protein